MQPSDKKKITRNPKLHLYRGRCSAPLMHTHLPSAANTTFFATRLLFFAIAGAASFCNFDANFSRSNCTELSSKWRVVEKNARIQFEVGLTIRAFVVG